MVVEDDYDGEFHYEGRPLESLQGLDREGRIVYIGTFSRTVFPSMRIGYLVAPASLVRAFTAAKWLSDLHSASLEQQTLADFIAGGMYERHLRRLRRRNTARRTALLEAIAKYLGDRVEGTGEGAGAQVVLWPRKKVVEEAGGGGCGKEGRRDLRNRPLLVEAAVSCGLHPRLCAAQRAGDSRRNPASGTDPVMWFGATGCRPGSPFRVNWFSVSRESC